MKPPIINQLKEQEEIYSALEQDKNFMKKFGRVVGIFNSMNNTEISVKEALRIPEIVEFYECVEEAATTIYQYNEKISTKYKSTKLRSYDKLNTDTLDYEVFNALYSEDLTRSELVEKTGISIQTLSGCVTRLIKSGRVKVVGESYDKKTNRVVEKLRATGSL